ncbi:MAG: ABC transporter ATP-binding protein [Chloroflexi bacterium]|nr:ABC transporter ATP-binding protein [Chloroflexota bacterium]
MIDVRHLNFTYPGAATQTLKDLNFQIAMGEILGFLGPSGAGKTTTQKILIGLLTGFEGEISVMGKPLQDWGYAYYDRIGVSFELPNHYLKLTALENLAYFASLYRGETRDPQELLEMVGLGEDGGLKVAEFSKGMKNRLNVARSLLHKPELLFLDEPTAGLDPVNSRRIKNLIAHLKSEGTTIFLSTHDMVVADELSDQVGFIVDGEIKSMKSPRDLKLEHGQRMVRVEFGLNGTTESRECPLDGLAENNEFIATIGRDDLQTIHTQEPTLETIFIEVTGRELG